MRYPSVLLEERCIFSSDSRAHSLLHKKKELPLLSWHSLSTEMASFALSASHPAQSNGLDRNLLTDVLWSVQMCLCKNVSLYRETLLAPELEMLEGCIVSLIEPFPFFRNKTGGNLPDLWRREEEEYSCRCQLSRR